MLKPKFLFGDALAIKETKLLRIKEEWFIENGGFEFHIPATDRHLPLSVFRTFSEARVMQWHLTPSQGGLLAGNFKLDTHSQRRDTFVTVRDGPSYSLRVLLLGHMLSDFNPSLHPFGASTFCNQLLAEECSYPQ
ncbi:hypothetical protein ACDT16_13835, partial [Staphylococcus aureus]